MERVLVLGLSSDRGGIENYILNIYKNMNHNELQFDFLVKEDLCDDYKKIVCSYGGRIFITGTFKRNVFKVWAKLNDLYKKNAYEKIYVNMSYAPTLIYVIPAIHRGLKKLFLHSHASDDVRKISHYLFRFLFYKILLKKIDCVYMGCSLDACKWQFGETIFRTQRMNVVNNAVDYDRFKYSPEKRTIIRDRLGIPRDAIVVGHVGRFSPEKNHDFIIRTFKKLNITQINSYLLLVGDGYLRNTIQDLVNSECLSDKVIFAGNVEDTSIYYSAMDCFWLPSLYEGFPIVAIEAQTNGLKCICSDRITQKVNVLGNVSFCSINAVDGWIKPIITITTHENRLIKRAELMNVGFDLKNQINDIERILTA